MTREELIHEAWVRGELEYKLHPTQRKIYRSIKENKRQKFCLNCSRRLGKTYVLSTISVETCLKKPGAMVRFANPTGKSLRKILLPIFNSILSDCPAELRPVFLTQESVFRFNNGAEIHLAGTDAGNAESLRGQAADLCVIDEAGSMTELEYLMNDILFPQLIGSKGKMLIASTPPKSIDHPFKSICDKAILDNHYAHFTIYDSHYDPKTIEEFKVEAGGEHSTTWRREYLAEFVTDSDSAIVPEFNDRFVTDISRDNYFQFYHKYLSLDLGVKRDLTAGLFAHYDFRRAKLVVEDEFHVNGPEMTTEILATIIKAREIELKYGKMYRRIADNNNPLLLNDLAIVHGISIIQVEKTDLHGMVNRLRLMFNEGRIEIDRKCRYLIQSLKSAIWDNHRREFARSYALGHFDHVAALIYLVMMLDIQTNPIPAMYGVDPLTHQLTKATADDKQRNQNFKTLEKLFPTRGAER